LLAVVAISCCFAYRAGLYCISKHPPKIKKHGYKPFNTARYGLDLLIYIIRGNSLHKHARYYKKLAPLLAVIFQYLDQIKIFVV